MLPSATVFVVDDDEANRESMASFAASLGLSTEAHVSAESMLAAYDGQRVGCALVDLRLPGMSGLELMEELMARDAPLGIVLVSGQGDVRAAVRAMKNGAVDFLHKPYSFEELHDSLRRALEVAALRRQNTEAAPPLGALKTLSESERQVLELMARGMANKLIASELGISLRTVHLRRASLMRKLGATNRAGLIRLAVEMQMQKPGDTILPSISALRHSGMEQSEGALRDRPPNA